MAKINYLTLNRVQAYKCAFHLSNKVWSVVSKWDNFAKYNMGGQFVRSVDSISANIAEGFGRYHKKDKILFYRYSQGSIKESLDWNEKAKMRKLLSQTDYADILMQLKQLPKELNTLIKITHETLAI